MRYIREGIQVPYKSEQRRLENSHISGGGKFVLKKTSSWCENLGGRVQNGEQLYQVFPLGASISGKNLDLEIGLEIIIKKIMPDKLSSELWKIKSSGAVRL